MALRSLCSWMPRMSIFIRSAKAASSPRRINPLRVETFNVDIRVIAFKETIGKRGKGGRADLAADSARDASEAQEEVDVALPASAGAS